MYKAITPKKLLEIFTRSALTSGSCLILLGGANVFGRVLTLEQIPVMSVSFLTGIASNRVLLLLIVTFILFVAGMFMGTISAIAILGPLLLNVVTQLGVTLLHLGILMVMNLVIGQSTPPVGVNLFVGARIGGVKLEQMIRWFIPMLLLMYAVLLFTFAPGLATLLPNLLHGAG